MGVLANYGDAAHGHMMARRAACSPYKRKKWGQAWVVSVACTMYPMFYMRTDDDYGTIVTSVNPCLGCPWLYFSGRTGHDRNEQSIHLQAVPGTHTPRSREAAKRVVVVLNAR